MSDIRSLIEKLDQINESEEVNKIIRDAVKKLGQDPSIEDVEKNLNIVVKYIRDQLQSRDNDSFVQGIERGFKRFSISADYIKRQHLGMTAEHLGLPGLYSIPDGKSYVYTDKDQSGNYKSARFSSIEDAVKLYKAGYVTRDKALELRKDNVKVALKDPKHPANALYGEPGPAAEWAKTNPIKPSSLGGASTNANTGTNALGVGRAGAVDPSLAPQPGDNTSKVVVTPIPEPVNTSQTSTSDYVSKRLTSADINNLNQFKTDEIATELMNDLRKLLNILNDSKLNFKSDIALGLVESDRLYERELSASDEEKLRIIVHNLKLLEPKASPVLKARLGNYLEKIPQKYLSAGTPAAAADNPPAATATKIEPDASTTSTSKKITWQDLAKLNPEIKNPNLIYPGQEIKLPNGSSAVVDKGDTLGSLAQRWNDGGYNDANDLPAVSKAPAAAVPADNAPAAAAPAPTATATLKPSEANAISIEIKTALLQFRNQDLLDKIWMNIKSKENFDAIDAQFRTTGKKGIIDAVNSEWGYSKDKQFTPMLKRLGIATK
jgi:LysM repeat protein